MCAQKIHKTFQTHLPLNECYWNPKKTSPKPENKFANTTPAIIFIPSEQNDNPQPLPDRRTTPSTTATFDQTKQSEDASFARTSSSLIKQFISRANLIVDHYATRNYFRERVRLTLACLKINSFDGN